MGHFPTALFVLVIALILYCFMPSPGLDPESIARKRVCITGASSGIGEQLAYHYATLKASLVLVARRSHLLQKVATRCVELGATSVDWVVADLGNDKDREMLMDQLEDRLGGLDHLILNHAILSYGWWLGSRDNLTTLTRDLNVNFVSYVDLASKAMPMLVDSGGHLGVVGSVAGRLAIPVMATYTTTKFAMAGFFSALRQELLMRKANVTVTVCTIGPVDTDIIALDDETRKSRANLWFNPSATPQDAAWAILTAVAIGQKELYFGNIAWVIVALHKVFPDWMEGMFGSYTARLVTSL